MSNRQAIFDKSRIHLALQCLLHALPVSVTVFILSLTFRRVYWSDTNNPHLNSQLAAFQFAAKFQEALVIASLSAVVVSILTVHLCGEGIPFGMVVASYQFAQLSNLWRRAFWAGLLHYQSNPKIFAGRIIPSVVVALATILAAIIGPATAVALIPTLGWWQMPDYPYHPYSKHHKYDCASSLLSYQKGRLFVASNCGQFYCSNIWRSGVHWGT